MAVEEKGKEAEAGDPVRFRSVEGEGEALIYDGGFPLDFLRAGETVGAMPDSGGACYVETEGGGLRVDKGDLLVRDVGRLLHVLKEVTNV